VNVEHEEVLLMPRWVDCRRATFKYGHARECIDVLETLHKLGLERTDKVRVGGVEVAPRDVVAACLPNPAEPPYLDQDGVGRRSTAATPSWPGLPSAATSALSTAGFQVHVHAIGDRGVREPLDAFEYAARTATTTRPTTRSLTRRATSGIMA
jgi:hypothetical protein